MSIPPSRVSSIESEHAEVGGEPAQVHIEDETKPSQRARPHPQPRRDVDRLEDRINGDAVSVVDEMGEVHRFAVDEQRFDDVAHGPSDYERPCDLDAAPLRRKKIVQLGVEADPAGGTTARRRRR